MVSYYLDIKVKQSDNGVFVSQKDMQRNSCRHSSWRPINNLLLLLNAE